MAKRTRPEKEARLAEFRAAVEAAAGTEPYFTAEYLDELREADRQRALRLPRFPPPY